MSHPLHMLQSLLIPVVLLANGLGAGVLAGTLLGGFPLLAALPPDRYVHAHAFFATRYDPFMPTCLVVTFLGDATLAATVSPVPGRVAAGIAGVLAATVMTISLTKNVPVNKWVQTLDPGGLPADFANQDPRGHWGRWNRRRSLLAMAALLANCTVVGFVI